MYQQKMLLLSQTGLNVFVGKRNTYPCKEQDSLPVVCASLIIPLVCLAVCRIKTYLIVLHVYST